jgi:hypothetical protein
MSRPESAALDLDLELSWWRKTSLHRGILPPLMRTTSAQARPLTEIHRMGQGMGPKWVTKLRAFRLGKHCRMYQIDLQRFAYR